MNKVPLSLCLFGAALATANILIMQRSTCSSGGEVAAADKATSSIQPEAVSIGKPAQAPNVASFQAELPAQAPKLAASEAEPRHAPNLAVNTTKPPKVPKAAAKPPTPAPQDVQVTGSVGQTPRIQGPKGETPASASLAQLTEDSAWPGKGEDKPEEWAEVSLAAKVHNAPSVSSPTIRLYRVGTRLKVIGRESGWIKVADPTTSQEGWIYEKYLTPREGSDQKQKGTPQQKMSDDDMNGRAPTKPEPYARPYRPRKYGWRWYYSRQPTLGFGIGVYPRW